VSVNQNGVAGRAASDYGALHAEVSTAIGVSSASQAEWEVDFRLFGPGPVTLAIAYEYDAAIAASPASQNSNSSGDFSYWLDSSVQQHVFYFEGFTDTQFDDRCQDRGPGALPPGACAGVHQGAGVAFVTFQPDTPASLHAYLNTATLSGGSALAFNTGRVTGITVPDGVTWRYDDLDGNPLNFHHATVSPVPEPSVWASFAMGLAALGHVVRRRRARR